MLLLSKPEPRASPLGLFKSGNYCIHRAYLYSSYKLRYVPGAITAFGLGSMASIEALISASRVV